VVARWSQSTKVLLYTPDPDPVSAGMGDRLVAGKLSWFVASHSCQLSLLPSAGRRMSAVTLCGWGIKAITVCVGGRQNSVTRVIPERFRGEFLMIKRYTNLRLLTYLLDIVEHNQPTA